MPVIGTAWLCGFTVTSWCRAFFGGQVAQHLSGRSPRFFQRGIFGVTLSDQDGHKLGRPPMNSSANMSQHGSSAKPPNVLLYTGSGNTADKKYHQLKESLSTCLDEDSYAIYRLDEKHVLTQPWSENTVLLVVAGCFKISELISCSFMEYLKKGGRIFSLCSGFCPKVEQRPSVKAQQSGITAIDTAPDIFDEAENVKVICEPFFYEYTGSEKNSHKVLASRKESGEALIVQISEGTGTAVLSLVQLDEEVMEGNTEVSKAHQESNLMRQKLLSAVLQRLGLKCSAAEVPELTPAYLFASQKDQEELMASLRPILTEGICKGSGLSLLFLTQGETPPAVTKDVLPVIVGESAVFPETSNFDWLKYASHLNTKVLGKILLYSSVTTSTQAFFDGNYSFAGKIPKTAGAIAVAGRQVKGKGRGGNTWLSPRGCLMFSLHVRVDFNTELGSRLPYLQHIASLAVVEAVRTLPGYEEINICLKWPNDIYFGREVKIGGVIVTSSACDGCFSAVIGRLNCSDLISVENMEGMGVNLSNSKPTVCINDMIRLHNNERGTELELLCAEVLLARTVNHVETLIDDFQMNGSDSFREKYYKRWLHSNTQVCLNTDGKPEEATIKGLDEFGFLLVQKKSGQMCSVQPDGNSFDMLKNLITVKIN